MGCIRKKSGRAKPLVVCLLMVLWVTGSLGAVEEEVLLSQIDSSRLVTDQEIDLYVRATEEQAESLRFYEVPRETSRSFPLRVVERRSLREKPEPVNLFLLVDNSGSMYFDMENQPTLIEEDRRMTYARRALKRFFQENRGSADSLTLAAFNLRYSLLVERSDSPAALESALDEIERPQGDEGFTELYESLWRAADFYQDTPGRKVIILLSDGENYTYAENREEGHPVYGDRLRSVDEVVAKLRAEEVSLYSISFGEMEVSYLEEMSRQAGGRVYDAADEEALLEAYRSIRAAIAGEYLVTCRANTLPAEERWVVVTDGQGTELSRLAYRLPHLFGVRSPFFTVLPFLSFLLALVLRWAMTYLPWRNTDRGDSLRVLHFSGTSPRNQVIPLERGHTTLGWSDTLPLSAEEAGAPPEAQEHLDIIYQEEQGEYLLKSTRAVLVNNQLTQERVLQGGDVISIDGTSLVIDLEED